MKNTIHLSVLFWYEYFCDWLSYTSIASAWGISDDEALKLISEGRELWESLSEDARQAHIDKYTETK